MGRHTTPGQSRRHCSVGSGCQHVTPVDRRRRWRVRIDEVRVQVGIEGRGLRGTYGVRHEPDRPGLPAEEVWEPGPYLRAIPPLLERLRGALGDDIELLHDVHERLTPIEAARLAKELEPFH